MLYRLYTLQMMKEYEAVFNKDFIDKSKVS